MAEITWDQFEAVDMRVARVLAAPLADGTRAPSRAFLLDVGSLGQLQSVGQVALVEESDLVGRNVVVCVNLGSRKIGKYRSEALVMGARLPSSPPGQAQATPLFVDDDVPPCSRIF